MAGVILYGRQSGMNVTVRYNAFENVGSIGGSGYLCLGDDATSVTSDGYDVYGNVFFSTSANEGPGLYVVGNASADVVTGVRIFNNTIYGMRNTSSFWFGHGGPTVVVSNNVWQACAISPTFNNCVEGNNLKNTGGATFLDPAKGNFHLVSDTSTKWIPLASPFDRDADGLTRLSSIGAYQFGSGVISSNRPPVVSAGSDQTITLPNSVVLAGTASDPDGNVMTVSWTTVSGPAGVTLSAANVLRPTATFSASGIYTFRLAASDGSLSAIDEVVVTVNPQSTTGSTLAFEAESGLISAPFTVTSGYISQTIDSQLSMSTGGRAVYNFSISEAGDYRIKAVVNAPSAAENSFFINVDADPQNPTMIWDVPVTTGFEDRWVSLRGTGTFDNNQFSPMTFSLASGPHQLIVIGREPNAQLDRLDVSKVPAPPTQLRLAQLP